MDKNKNQKGLADIACQTKSEHLCNNQKLPESAELIFGIYSQFVRFMLVLWMAVLTCLTGSKEIEVHCTQCTFLLHALSDHN